MQIREGYINFNRNKGIMIQLTDSLSWDESTDFDRQSNEVKNFVQNVIQTYDKVTEKEAIPASPFFRVLKATYAGLTFEVVEKFEYIDSANSAGWAAIETYKIECYAK